MANVPEELKYTKDHEWARIEGDQAVIGITDHAQTELGDIVFVELPKVGAKISAGQSFGTVEAVKTVAELYAPVDGEVLEVNGALSKDAGILNLDPYGDGWIVKVKLEKTPEDLLDAAGYKALT